MTNEEEVAAELARYEESALLFLRAGGRLTLAEFAGLPPVKQAAAARAGDKFLFVTTALQALASQSPAHALGVLALVDGGKAQRKANLVDMVREVARQTRGG